MATTNRNCAAKTLAAIVLCGFSAWLSAAALAADPETPPATNLTPTTRPVADERPTPDAAERGPIRVGVLLSHASAVDGWFGNYKMVGRTFRDGLRSGNFDIYAVVEPDTAPLAELSPDAAAYFGDHAMIECTDVEAMRRLDVLVAPALSHVTPAMVNAVERAVRDDGAGLLVRMWFGEGSPGLTPRLLALRGLSEGRFGWNPKDQSCEVVDGDHPILRGVLATGERLKLEPNGAYGIYSGTPLIRLSDSTAVGPNEPGAPTTHPANYVVAPLSVATLGKGRIVCCSWLGHQNDPRTQAALNEITIRSVRWLGHDPKLER